MGTLETYTARIRHTAPAVQPAVGRRPNARSCSAQRGNALIGFAPFLAIMMVFLIFIADVGQYVFLRLSVDNAACTASHSLSDDTGLSNAQLADIATSASPALAGGGLEIRSTVSPIQNAPYVHHLPSDSVAGGFLERASNAAYRSVRVTAIYRYAPTTPFGRLMARQGGGGMVELTASYAQVADATAEAAQGVSPW